MKTSNIKQIVTFKASQKNLYEAIMDSKKHSTFTGAKAVISKKVNGKFIVYDGYASGKNIKLITNKKIVQSWRADDWPKDHYSEITFLFKPLKNGTKLIFTQKNIPIDFYSDIKQGWIDFYWKPMKKMFKKNSYK